MCGFVGILRNSGSNEKSSLIQDIKNMNCRLNHRGPDDSGIWIDNDSRIALGHKRLAIIDISKSGSQPMRSNCGRYTLVFNGEIYNFEEIRFELNDKQLVTQWNGHSDTEVLLSGISRWGLEATLRKCIGMFAIAVWDHKKNILSLARDRVGEKPLYYGWDSKEFRFASELKSLAWGKKSKLFIDKEALSLYLRLGYIPSPFTIFKNIFKLCPGSILDINIEDIAKFHKGLLPISKKYWELEKIISHSIENPFLGSDKEAVDLLDELLHSSVRNQMISDVPLGTFLSGGIDSSTITAIMQAQSNKKINTFTVGFDEKEYQEAPYAAAISRYLGTNHVEMTANYSDILNIIPVMPFVFDEPFSDPSQLPTYLVSKLTRQHVTVCLSGDGGDELFGGYNRYFLSKDIRRLQKILTPFGSKLSAFALKKIPINYKLGESNNSINRYGRSDLMLSKLRKLGAVIDSESPQDLYLNIISIWRNPHEILINYSRESLHSDMPKTIESLSITELMMMTDLMRYLPENILVKVDRSAMASSLESRIPFLDHRIIEYVWRLPENMKIRNREGKWILKQVLKKYLPYNLFDRPKMGFGVPISKWLRGPLKEWASNLLDEKRLIEEGIFNPVPIHKLWDEHIRGVSNNSSALWTILMFQSWLESHKDIVEMQK